MTKKGAPSRLQNLSDPLFATVPDEMLRVCTIGGTGKVLKTFASGSDTSTDDYVTGVD